MNRIALVLCTAFFSPSLLAQSNAISDSERLERLERAVQLLQQRNTELEKEVSSLKAKKCAPVASAPSVTAPTPASDIQAQIETGDVNEAIGYWAVTQQSHSTSTSRSACGRTRSPSSRIEANLPAFNR